jgi:hypothetical protein
MNLQDQLAERMASEIAKEIDFEVLASMLCELGWTRVVLKPMTWEQGAAIDDWVSNYISGPFETMGLVWLFESSKDATMFILKWSS